MSTTGFNKFFFIAALFWFLAACSIPPLFHIQNPPAGWDVDVYHHAIDSLRAGRDPYLDGIAVQRARHAEMLLQPERMPPYTYVYSPLTLPILGLIARIPLYTTGVVYWSIYCLAMIVLPCTLLFASQPRERNLFLLLAPAAPFFPGLIQTNVFFSGNIAYILYALTFAAAVLGWKRNLWWPFYLVVLFASACKAPLLTLLLLPVFSVRKHWIPAGITAALGLGLFFVQPLLWPALMSHYLEAVELQFSFNHDFGVSAAGVLGEFLFLHGHSYSFICTIFYLLYATAVFLSLWRLSRAYFAGRFTLQQFLPTLLVGVILLNPRVKEYDVAAVALPMAYLLWRTFHYITPSPRRASTELCLFFIAINAVGMSFSADVWRPVEMLLLSGLYISGAWMLTYPKSSQSRWSWQSARPEEVLSLAHVDENSSTAVRSRSPSAILSHRSQPS